MQNRPLVGIGVLIFNKNGKILLGKRISPHGEGSWGPPGGHLEFEESFEVCARREVKEEVGLDIQEPRFLSVTNNLFEQDNKHYVSIFMCCDFPKGQIVTNREPNKISQWKWFPTKSLPSNLFLPLKNLVIHGGYGQTLPKNFSIIDQTQ